MASRYELEEGSCVVVQGAITSCTPRDKHFFR